MVARADQFLDRAKTTVLAAHNRLAIARGDRAILEGVAVDASRSMYQAINAFFPTLWAGNDGAEIEVRFEQEVVRKGLISAEVFRLFINARDERARVAYRFDVTFDERNAEESLARAEHFLAAVENAISIAGGSSRISKTKGVCGGAACIGNTRIPVWTLVQLQKLGRTESQLLWDYPSLKEIDLDAAWKYYRENPMEIDALIDGQEREE